MLKVAVYTFKGTKTGTFSLPKEFEEKENLNLLAQAIRVYEDRSHPGHAKVKTRGEVNLTTKKWYSQKGTGGARHGAKSAPIFVGGGVAHGPKGIKRELSLNSKMKKKALNVALSLKAKNKELFVVSDLNKMAKTKEADSLVSKISKSLGQKVKRFTFVLGKEGEKAQRAVRNLEFADIVSFKNLNAHKVFHSGVLLIDKSNFEKEKKAEK